ncbi:WD40 repeat domain-containing protein [Asanoa sp. NPDC049573]|uniref:WD40 repeat domain-containing protein n=1 Tax=Asanoa sp. NPDC049573 TaxID=3155396 RepID=UPI0034156168
MTGRLLKDLADEMPPARLPDDLWAAGRRRRQRRRLSYAVTAVVVLVLAVALPDLVAHRRAAEVPADRPGAVPSRVEIPHLWQAKVGQWPAGAGGQAALVFSTSKTRYFEGTGVAVGVDGSYRLIYREIGEDAGLLTPDGRYYVRGGLRLLDLTTGEERQLSGEPIWGVPLAWSPDGSELLIGVSNDDGVITYGDDNVPDNDPEKPDDLVAVDMRTGARRLVAVGRFNSYTAAAWSPDGTRIAVDGPVGRGDTGRRISVMDAHTGAPVWTRDVPQTLGLAGRGAWSPDGRRLALFAFDGCVNICDPSGYDARRWRVEQADPATGELVGAPLPLAATPETAVGWRDGRDLVFTYSPNDSADPQVTLVALRPDGTLDTLVDTPVGVSGLEIPENLLRAGAFGGPAAHPSMWAAPAWAYLLAAVPVLLLLWIVRGVVRRARRRRRKRERA